MNRRIIYYILTTVIRQMCDMVYDYTWNLIFALFINKIILKVFNLAHAYSSNDFVSIWSFLKSFSPSICHKLLFRWSGERPIISFPISIHSSISKGKNCFDSERNFLHLYGISWYWKQWVIQYSRNAELSSQFISIFSRDNLQLLRG